MRELIGKIQTRDPAITEVVYLTEMVRCLESSRRGRWASRWSRSRKVEKSRKILRHVCYCRGHGFDYERKAQSQPIRPHGQCEASLRFDNSTWSRRDAFRDQRVDVSPTHGSGP